MANVFKNTDLVLKGVIAEIMNSMVLGRAVTRNFDSSYDGDHGNTITKRRPNKMRSVNGPDVTGLIQDYVDSFFGITIDQFPSVPVEISAFERTFDLTDARQRSEHLPPMAIEIVQRIESFIANNYWKIPNFAGTPGTTPGSTNSLEEVGNAVNLLHYDGVPVMDTNIFGFFEPDAALKLASGVQKNFFGPNVPLRALEKAMVNEISNAKLHKCLSLVNHTVGNYAGSTPLVNGAGQNVAFIAPFKDTLTQTIVTDGWVASTQVLNRGDVLTFDGVFRVQAKSYETINKLRTFTVMSPVTSDGAGNATITISPPLFTSGAHQNVSAAPGDDATITVVSGASGQTYPQNLILHKNAFHMAVVKPKQPKVPLRTSVTMEGFSLAYTAEGEVLAFKDTERIDAWFGGEFGIPTWACRVTG